MRDILKSNYHWVTLFVLVILVGLVDSNFWNVKSLLILIGDIVPLFIMALGLTFAIYIGGIDLSAQSMANMITVIASLYLASLGLWIVPMCFLVGAALGGLSGLITTRFLVPSFISTLAIGGVCYSLAQWLSGNRALYMDSEIRDALFGWMLSSTGIVPNTIFVGAAVFAGALLIERRSTLGRRLKAVGSAELAAVASGMRVSRVKVMAFALSGGLAALAGVIFAIKLSGGAPSIANGFLLPAIVAVLVGGTPLTGGVGGVVNTLVGTMIVAVIRSSMLYLEVEATHQQMVFGVVLIIAIVFTIDRSKLSIVK
ncbi:MAG: ABC transporter permease [Roseovarius sp.]|nr:ABC transporter permease [Roseovarius sp.]MCY4316095.1 ABC transporter permease [Roseovarius sp.]